MTTTYSMCVLSLQYEKWAFSGFMKRRLFYLENKDISHAIEEKTPYVPMVNAKFTMVSQGLLLTIGYH